MNYIMTGLQWLKCGISTGLPLYIGVIILLHILKIRRIVPGKCVPEMIFCVYGITLLGITGIFSLKYSLSGTFSYGLVPFVGSSIVPALFNFLLFVPYGFLLPLVFGSCKWNWKRATVIGAVTSAVIEFLQMFGGRYAETEDLLLNTLGTFSGYVIFSCLHEIRGNRRKAVMSALSLCLALIVCFAGIYAVGDNGKQLPDGLEAAESHITEVSVCAEGERCTIEAASYVYHCFASQLANCGGHLLRTQSVSEDTVKNDSDCFIEVIYDSPQTITFENAGNFVIEDADRILYNADRNILYWGNSGYQSCLDYTELTSELQEHRDEILKGYERLGELIRECVRQ